MGQGGDVAILPEFGRPFVGSGNHDGEEKNQEAANAYHDAECPEVDGDVGHHLILVLDVAVAEVFHILVDGGKLCAEGIHGYAIHPRLAIVGEREDGLLASFNLLVDGGLARAIGFRITIQQVVDAGHKAMDIVGGHERQGIGHLELQRRRHVVCIVGLAEGIDPCDGSEADIGATIVECFHGSQFHGLHFGNVLCGLVSGSSSEQGGNETDDGANLEAFERKSCLAFLHQVPAADAHAEDCTDNPRRGDGVTELRDSKG